MILFSKNQLFNSQVQCHYFYSSLYIVVNCCSNSKTLNKLKLKFKNLIQYKLTIISLLQLLKDIF